MRKLKTSDIPAFCRCLKNIGIKDKIKEISQSSDTVADAWNKGFDLLWNIFDIATEKKAEIHIYEFLALPFEMSAEKIADLELGKFFDLCEQLAKENDLKGFFSYVGKSMR